MKSRSVKFLTTKVDANGARHYSIASYDSLTKMVTYFSDYVFKTTEIATW